MKIHWPDLWFPPINLWSVWKWRLEERYILLAQEFKYLDNQEHPL